MNKLRAFFYNNRKKNNFIVIGSIIIFLLVIFISTSFAELVPVKSVEISSTTLSYENKDGGSFQIIKTAEWTAIGRAKITLELNTLVKEKNKYTDIILVLDTSGSMIDGRLEQVKVDVNELVSELVPKGSNFALIKFNDTSSVVTDFTNDIVLLQEEINNLIAAGDTNYYQALVNVDSILSNYQKQDNRDCVVLFLTDGLPTTDVPNEIVQYEYLKSTYSYLTINGIQYEMGENPLAGIKNVTDNQYIADIDTLNDYIFKAAFSPAYYDSFVISDYIDNNYFNVVESSIDVSSGNVTLEDNIVNWDLSGINSGGESKLTMDVNLKGSLIGTGGIYPTNEKLSVFYKIEDIEETVNSTLTPVLADNYVVSYEANAPSNCVVSNMPSSINKSVFDTVQIETTKIPICDEYQFKEWEIVTEGVEKVSKDYFIMPEKNVTLRATWKKMKIDKSMDGEIYVVPTLYQVVADSSNGLDTNIKFDSISSSTNGLGVYTVEETKNDEYPVHYYRGAVTNNNVLFAGFCWQMVRTTSTGGVKLIYNGKPDADGQCLSTRSNAPGYTGSIARQLSNKSYYYGSSYTYDSSTKLFTLDGDLQLTRWSSTTGPGLVNSYTCLQTTAEATCSTLYQVASYSSSSIGVLYYVEPLNYSYIGEGSFNDNDDFSIADAGYMYDTRYVNNNIRNSSSTSLFSSYSTSSTSQYYYSKDMVINEDGTYSLQNAEQKNWSDNYSSLVGYYTCRKTVDEVCSTVYYIVGGESSYQYVSILSGGNSLIDKIYLSQSTTKNDDGTYGLVNPIEISYNDWYRNYSLYKKYYICGDSSSASCGTSIRYITATSNYNYTYDSFIGFAFGSSMEYDEATGYYTLKDLHYYNSSTSYEDISEKYHYTCNSTSTTCQNVYYIYAYYNSSYYSLKFQNGVDLEKAKDEMFINDKNSSSSEIKEVIDLWYSLNMIDYTDKIEDTVWCNDRTLVDGRFYSDAPTEKLDSTFAADARLKSGEPSIFCPKYSDSFTVDSSIGNGLLIYPVGLLTSDEVNMAGGFTASNNSYYLYGSNCRMWTMTPSSFNVLGQYGYVVSVGYLNSVKIFTNNGIRPAISLKGYLKLLDGDGSESRPYIIE